MYLTPYLMHQCDVGASSSEDSYLPRQPEVARDARTGAIPAINAAAVNLSPASGS
jgi:hypothetical protein